VSAALLVCEMAVSIRATGRTILEQLDDIYRRVGLFLTEQVSLTKPGTDGLAQIKAAMDHARAAPPTQLAGLAIERVDDLLHGADGLPPSDVLVFRIAGGRRVIMRPSGTEPKLKSYYEVRVAVGADEPMDAARARGQQELAQLRDAHQALLK
jgi:phosphomannomutase